MPKNKTTDQAIAAITNADKAASEAKAELLKSIPAPIVENAIPFVKVFTDRNLNIRDNESYDVKDNLALYHSLKEFGFQMRNPFASFSKQIDGRLKAISGNLRVTMMGYIRQEEIDRRAKENIVTDEPLPFETIHGLVWEGLTPDQERALVADQLLQKKLNEFELARAIGELWEVTPKMTDAKMSVYWGLDTNKVQRLRMRYCMPTVFAEFRKEKGSEDVPYVKVDNKTLTNLYAAYKNDRDAGNKHREEGPAFRRAWDTFLSNPEVFKTEKDKADADLAKKASVIADQAKATIAGFGDTPEINAIRKALLWAAGKPDDDGEIPNLYKVQEDVKAYCDELRSSAVSPIMHGTPEIVDLTEGADRTEPIASLPMLSAPEKKRKQGS